MGLLLLSVPTWAMVPSVVEPPVPQFCPKPSQTCSFTVLLTLPVTTAVKSPVSLMRMGASAGVRVNCTLAAAPSGRRHTATISKTGLLLDTPPPRRPPQPSPRGAPHQGARWPPPILNSLPAAGAQVKRSALEPLEAGGEVAHPFDSPCGLAPFGFASLGPPRDRQGKQGGGIPQGARPQGERLAVKCLRNGAS